MKRTITEQQLNILRDELKSKMSERRYQHTIMVEEMAVLLGNIYAPSYINELRAASLLHDLTKEYTSAEHRDVFKTFNYKTDRDFIISPKCHHAISGWLLIPIQYPEFASEKILNAVRYHTTGRANMTITEKIIYLADYIDMSRSFADCINLRNYFFERYNDKMTKKQLETLLNETLILSFDMTIKVLISGAKIIAPDTIKARNSLIIEREN